MAKSKGTDYPDPAGNLGTAIDGWADHLDNIRTEAEKMADEAARKQAMTLPDIGGKTE